MPIDDLERFQCTEADLEHGRSVRVIELLRYECDRAKEFYGKARLLLSATDRRQLVAAEIMAAIYFSILRRIERRGYDVFSEVISVPRAERALSLIHI